MKNVPLLLIFFVALGCMFVTMFVPNLEEKNSIDQLHYSLYDVKDMIPDTSKVYLLQNESLSDTELYYKSQFLLAPRIVISARYTDIPKGSYMLLLKHRSESVVTDSLFVSASPLYAETDRYFSVKLTRKAQ
jgi:hypothetical protein